MADLSIAIEILGVDKASGAFTAVGSAAGGLLGGLKNLGLGVLGIGAAFDAGKSAIEGLIGPAIDAQQVATQTATVLKSTGEAAGLSIDDISGLASELSKLTPFEDEAIQSSENLLLTFTNVGGEVFPRAQEAILDMSQALGQDLKSSTVQLGKALNDPVKGITALSRVGVSFTDEQKEMIAAMVEAGDTAGAQGVILSELEKEFGGAAKAAGQTFGGQLVILQTAIGNVMEAIGGPLLGVLSQAAQAILPVVQGFADDLPGAIDDFMSAAAPVVSFLGSAFSGAASGLVTFVGQVLGLATGDYASAWEILGDLPAAFLNTFQPLIQTISDAWQTVIQVFQEDWSPSDQIDPVANIIGELAAIVRDDVLPTLELLGVIVTDVFSGDFQGALEAGEQVLSEALPLLVDDLGSLAQAFLGWVGPMIPPLLQQLLEVDRQIATWIYTVALPTIVENLGQWAGAFVDWVAPLIPPLMRELGTLALNVIGWMVNTMLPSLASNLLKWGLAFVEWVGPRILPLIGELAKLQLELLAWIVTTALPAIVGKLVEWGKAFVDWIAKDALPKLPGQLALIGQAIIDWAGQVLPSLAESAGAIGRTLVDDIRNGISGALDGLQRWVTENLANALPGWVRDVLGIHSPSSVFADIGANIIAGLERGIMRSWPSLEDLIGRLMERFRDLGRNVGGDVNDWLAAALAITGTDLGWLPGLRQLVAAESGGDPGAVNPIDVGNGEHAMGLLQTIPSTFRAYALPGFGDIFNPVDNAIAAIRYIRDRYGSVYNTPLFQGGEYGGYAEGGRVPGPPGAGQWAWVHGGEFNLTPDQYNALAGRGGGLTLVFEQGAIQGNVWTTRDLVDELYDGLVRKGLGTGQLAFRAV